MVFYESVALSQKDTLSALYYVERDSTDNFRLFLECASNIDTEMRNDRLLMKNNAREDITEVLNMAISTLEQQTVLNKDLNHRSFSISDFCDSNNIPIGDVLSLENYSTIYELALREWQEIELETMETATAWLQLLEEGNQRDTLRVQRNLQRLSKNALNYQTMDKNRKHSQEITSSQLKKKIEDELNAINILEKEVKDESDMLSLTRAEEELWNSRFALKISEPLPIIRSLLLCIIIPFEACTVQHDMLDLAFPHLDGSRTLLSWRSSTNGQENMNNESFESSAISLDSVDDIMKSRPSLRRITASPFVENRRLQDGIPYPRPLSLNVNMFPFLSDAYNTFMRDNRIKTLLASMWIENKASAIAVSSDIFGRFDLAIKDFLELQKYYACTFDKSESTKKCDLVVVINYGLERTIGIRFTYDFADLRCGLYCIPNQIYIFATKGEPPIPIHVLQKSAEYLVANNGSSNAFLLKRICAGVVDKLVTYATY